MISREGRGAREGRGGEGSCYPTHLTLFFTRFRFPLPFQAYLDEQLQLTNKSSVKVDAILIAPPNAGDRLFARSFNKLVNARSIPFVYDIVPQASPTLLQLGSHFCC